MGGLLWRWVCWFLLVWVCLVGFGLGCCYGVCLRLLDLFVWVGVSLCVGGCACVGYWLGGGGCIVFSFYDFIVIARYLGLVFCVFWWWVWLVGFGCFGLGGFGW